MFNLLKIEKYIVFFKDNHISLPSCHHTKTQVLVTRTKEGRNSINASVSNKQRKANKWKTRWMMEEGNNGISQSIGSIINNDE